MARWEAPRREADIMTLTRIRARRLCPRLASAFAPGCRLTEKREGCQRRPGDVPGVWSDDPARSPAATPASHNYKWRMRPAATAWTFIIPQPNREDRRSPPYFFAAGSESSSPRRPCN